MSPFHFSSNVLHLFASISFFFSLIFFSWFSLLPCLLLCLFFVFLFSSFSLNLSYASLPSTHAAKPICTSLLPLTDPTITNIAFSLLPLIEPIITNPSILSLIELTITNPTAYLLPLTEPTLLSLTEPKNPVLKPIVSSQNWRFWVLWCCLRISNGGCCFFGFCGESLWVSMDHWFESLWVSVGHRFWVLWMLLFFWVCGESMWVSVGFSRFPASASVCVCVCLTKRKREKEIYIEK